MPGPPGACPRCGRLALPTACSRHPTSIAPSACVVCGAAVCALCDAGTRHGALCASHRDVRLTQGWAEALRVHGELEAQLAAGELRAAGIAAHVLSQKDHANVVTFGGLSVVRVLVPGYLLPDARELLARD